MKGYNYSKDYDALYDFICAGNEAICLVDYDFYRDKKHAPLRDICKCRKDAEYTISFSARGIGYGNVYPWHSSHGSEFELFLRECKSMNVEWIKPYQNESIN